MKPNEELQKAAKVAITQVIRLQKEERVVIVSNPEEDSRTIAWALFEEVSQAGGKPTLVYQNAKTSLDNAEDAVIAALRSEPDVYISISHLKLGKDRFATLKPYAVKEPFANDRKFNHVTAYLLHGKKVSRGFWSPGITVDQFIQTVLVDYSAMQSLALGIKALLEQNDQVRITSAAGTDLRFSIQGRKAFEDSGKFFEPGTGGNLPAGETYISPIPGTAQGTLIYDGSLSVEGGTILLKEPVELTFAGGYIQKIQGGEEAQTLRSTLENAVKLSHEMEADERLPVGLGDVYAQNAYGLGELGIGINPKAQITGKMLVDEKAFRTCHLAIGTNYDMDAPTLIHLDGVVREPTIELLDKKGQSTLLMKSGDLQIGS